MLKKLIALMCLASTASAQTYYNKTTIPPPSLLMSTNSGGSVGVSVVSLSKVILRSNSGSAMTDTLPSAIAAGSGWQVTIINTDATATDTITPTAGTIGGGATLALLAGQTANIYSDGANYKVGVSDPLVAGPATVTSLTASGTVAANAITSSTTLSATGKITSADAIYSTGGTLPSSTAGQAAFIGNATNGIQIQGNGSSNDYQLLNGSGSQACVVGHGLNTLACQQVVVTGTTVTGNGLYRPTSTQLGFMSNALAAGMMDSGQHPRFGGSGTPTISSGNCGSLSNGTIVAGSSDVDGGIVIGAAATLTCTVSFNKTYDTAPRAIILQAASSAAAGQVTNVYVSSIGTTTFVITGTALASTNWYWHAE